MKILLPPVISLSFALAILLGDVFLHLLPEVWAIESTMPATFELGYAPQSNTTVLLGKIYCLILIQRNVTV